MIAIKDRVHKGAVDWPTVRGTKFRQPLRTFGERWAALSGPYHCVEGKPRHHLGMVLGKQRRAQRAGRNPVDEQRLGSAQLLDITGSGEAVLRPESNRGVVIAALGGTAIALHID